MTIKYMGNYQMWTRAKAVQYHKHVDLKLLESFGVDVVFYEPWQIGLFMEGLAGKFLWYPTAGTLVYDNSESGGGFTRIGDKGDYPASAMQHKGNPKPKPYVTELVYERIMQQFELENGTGSGITITSSDDE